MLKKVFPGRGSYKQEDLVAGLLHATYPAHDALEDVRALGKLTMYCSVPTQEMVKAIHFNCLYLIGLMNAFTGKNCEGQPRVTNTKRTLETVIPKLAEFFSRK